MTHIDWLAFAGTMATILEIFVGIYALINKNAIKSEAFSTRLLIKEGTVANRELFVKIEEGQQKQNEVLSRMAELIVADGERTGQIVRELELSSFCTTILTLQSGDL